MQCRFAKLCTLLIMVAIMGIPAASARADEGKKAFPYPIHKDKLDNGLEVISVPYDSPGIIAYYTVVRTGSRNEVEPGLSGFAHFFEHMMFRGTDRYSSEAFNNALKEMGADLNASTDDDWTRYYFTLASSALPKIMELEADRFQNLKYAEPEFQKEARAVLGEYNKSTSSPFLILNETMRDLAYTKHTYKHTTIGFLDDIKAMPTRYQYSLDFFKRWYRPENCAIIVVGDVNHQELVRLANKEYGSWKPGVAKIEIPQEPEQKEEKTKDLTWPTPTLPILAMGYHIPAGDPANPDTPALQALSLALFGETSDLYKKLVLEEQKVVNLFADCEAHRDASLFTVAALCTDPGLIPEVKAEIERTLSAAAQKPISAEKLSSLKSRIRYQFAASLDSPKAVADQLADIYAITGNLDSLNQLYDGFDRLKPEDLNRVAGKYFAKTNRTTLTLKTAAPKAAKPAPAPQLNTTVLKSASPVISVRLGFTVGSQNDPVGKEGLAALTASMLSEGGSKTLSYQQVLDRLYPMAASISGECHKEVTVFSGEVHRDNLDGYLAILSEILLEPRFATEDFERLKRQSIDGLTKGLRGNNDEALGKEVLNARIHRDGHVYGKPDVGTVAGLKAITIEDVKQFHKRYALDQLRVGLAGDVNDADIAKLSQALGRLPRQSAQGAVPLGKRAVSDELNITIVKKPSAAATAISLGFALDVTRADDDFYALAVANSYLGEHRTFNGKLMQDLRGKRGLNYGDYSYVEDFIQDGGSTFPIPNNPRRQQTFSIWIRPVPHDKAVFAIRGALWEFDKLVKNGLSQKDFESTRDYLLNYSKLWVQTPTRRLGFAMDGVWYNRKDLVTELANRLPKMTADDVNAAIKRHLAKRGFEVAIITQDADGIAETIRSGKATPLVYDTQGTPPDVIAEDKEIEIFSLGKPAIEIVPVETLFEK